MENLQDGNQLKNGRKNMTIERRFEDFKVFLVHKYHHPWHTLSNVELAVSLKEYNKTMKPKIKKFWD